MKIKKGFKWKSIEGLSKGKEFIVIRLTPDTVYYKAVSGLQDKLYDSPRNHFEKYIERVSKYWNETNKSYKFKKSRLRGEM